MCLIFVRFRFCEVAHDMVGFNGERKNDWKLIGKCYIGLYVGHIYIGILLHLLSSIHISHIYCMALVCLILILGEKILLDENRIVKLVRYIIWSLLLSEITWLLKNF